MNLLLALAAVVAVSAAVRSTWSPCGLSMLSTITPMAERSRGRNWASTAAWFLGGAVLGGATLGLAAAALAALVGLLSLTTTVALVLAAGLAVVGVGLDMGLLGTEMPHHRRQVDEVWLDQYRSWVYGAGFGWQIGTGFATYIMTAAVYLTVGLAALTGRPLVAFGLCVLFGFTRGMAIFLGTSLTDPDRLRVFHRRFEAAGPTVKWIVIGVQAAVAVVAAAAVSPLAGAAIALALGVATYGLRARVPRPVLHHVP